MLFSASIMIICCAKLISADEVLGCGGFIKSHVPIDFSKVIIKLYTKQGILKDETACAPNNGYYFIPMYDKGEYKLQLESPLGWTFDPLSVTIVMDGKTDLCSQGQDINFVFKGFGLAGRVGSLKSDKGPAGVTVELISARADTPARSTTSTTEGSFFFTLVYPGEYDIHISHPRWKLSKSQVKIHVSESDTQLPPNSLVVAGYDVNGVVGSENSPIPGVHLLLYSQNQKAKDISVSDCLTTNISPSTNQPAFLCYVTSNIDGNFRFPSVPTGSYEIVPQYDVGKDGKQHVYFSPESIKFNVNHDSVHLPHAFDIVAFSVSGKVLQMQAGQPLPNARIFFNDGYVGTTNKDGLYHIERAKAGSYKISVVHDEFEFDPVQPILSHDPSSTNLETLYPARYRVCGTVSSEIAQTIAITKVGSTQHVAIASEPSTGAFCHFLRPGQYQFEILDNNRVGDQFYPRTQRVEVGLGQKSAMINFTQLKAIVQGAVKCFANGNDCINIKVILRSTINSIQTSTKHMDRDHAQEVMQQLQNGTYKFNNIRPGTYVVYLTSNRFCWNIQEQDIAVTSFEYTVPDFIQTGYSISILSSHDTQIKYQQISSTSTESSAELSLTVHRLRPTTHCLSSPGTYTFTPRSCHGYNPTSYTIHTNNPHTTELSLNAVSHALSGYIRSEDSSPKDVLTVEVKSQEDSGYADRMKLAYQEIGFPFGFQLAARERRILRPISDTFLFTPEVVAVEGADDCQDVGEVIVAKRGKLFAGVVQPALVNVEITLSNGAQEWKTLTDSQGKYSFAPVPSTDEYRLSAHKESHMMTGPDKNGHFLAHKLAEVHVRVLDQRNEQPLQGALVSLSGGESYRRNLQTDKHGIATFQSLSPSEYFLRPVMKEYNFEPSSQMINVAEGATVNIKLTGKRVAYSAYGIVTSLNSDPEEDVIVIATGTGNCSQYSEESTSEANGSFRIRGLLPWCQYDLKVHSVEDKIGTDEDQVKVSVNIEKSDISGLRLIAFRPFTSTELLVSISTSSVPADQIRGNVYLKIVRVDGNAAYSTKVDIAHGETLVHVPAVPMDGTTYTVCADMYPQQCSKEAEYSSTVTANTSFHFVRLVLSGSGHGNADYTIPAKPPTSYALLTLVCVLACVCAAYNVEWVKRLVPIDTILGYLQSRRNDSDGKAAAIGTDQIDTSDIDQIVQSINATKRRVIKPKRI